MLLSRTMEGDGSSIGDAVVVAPSKRFSSVTPVLLAQSLQLAVGGCARRRGSSCRGWRAAAPGSSCGPRARRACWSYTSMPFATRAARRRPARRAAAGIHHAHTAGADLVDALQIAQGGNVDAGMPWRLPARWYRREPLPDMPSIVSVIIFHMFAILLTSSRSRRTCTSPCRRRT